MEVKNKVIYGTCAACGAKNDLDNRHKLADYIIKNPPTNQTEFKDKKTVTKIGKNRNE